jgi:porin
LIENRHVYGDYGTPPQNLAFEVGTHLPTAVKFSRMSTRVLVMHWGQSLFGGRAGFVVGQIAPDDYFNSYQLIHPFFNFYGYGSSISPTANWPNPGFGVGAGVKITDQFYVQALFGEAGGYRLDDEVFLHFGDNFFEGKFFTAVEVGWTPLSWAQRFVNRIAITAMHSDAYEQSPDENYAIALASNWTFGRWVPFLLAGVGNGKGENVVAKGTLTAGIGHNFRSHDVFGGSINWIQPPGGLRDQYTIETYYRFYASARVAVTPDLQVVFNPALDPSRDVLVLFGARLRVDL